MREGQVHPETVPFLLFFCPSSAFWGGGNFLSLLSFLFSFPLLVLWSAGDPTLAGNSLWSRKPGI